jgi:hypothetical protein
VASLASSSAIRTLVARSSAGWNVPGARKLAAALADPAEHRGLGYSRRRPDFDGAAAGADPVCGSLPSLGGGRLFSQIGPQVGGQIRWIRAGGQVTATMCPIAGSCHPHDGLLWVTGTLTETSEPPWLGDS